jgi:hypothetical protein
MKNDILLPTAKNKKQREASFWQSLKKAMRDKHFSYPVSYREVLTSIASMR